MSFLFPNFLYALFAMAIPVIIHLFNLRRPKKVYFSNLNLLKEVEQQTTRKLKVKSWLILLARMLFIAFLVFVFAQPVLRYDSAVKRSPKPLYSIYLDNSLSMTLPYNSDISVFQGALKELDQLIASLPRNARIQIVNNGFGGKSMVFQGKDQARELLTEMSLSRQFRSKREIYNRQLSALNKEQETDKTIIWLSDFQKTFFNDGAKLSLDTNIRHYFVPLKGTEQSNIFVDSIELSSPFIREGETNTLRIWLRNSGVTDQSNVSLKLMEGDYQISNQNIDMAGGATEKIELSFVLKDAGVHKLQLSVNDQLVSFDNDYFFVLNVGERIFVHEITDNKSSGLGKIYGNEQVFEFRSHPSDNIDFAALNGANLIILNEVKKLSNALKTKINAYLEDGGNVVIIPEPSNIKIFNELGLTVREIKDTSTVRVVVPKMDNPFFKGVMTKYVSKADMPGVTPILSVVNTKTPVLRLNNGNDYLAQVKSGKGTFYIFSSPFNESYSNIYKHSWVVPMCYRLAMITSSSNQNPGYRIGNPQVKVRFTSENAEEVLKLSGEGQEFIPGQRKLAGFTLLNMPEKEMDKGFYNVQFKDSLVDVLAFNYPKTESLLEYVEGTDIQNEYPQVKVLEQKSEINFSDTFSEQNIGVALWKYCLLLSLLFLALETLLIKIFK